MEKTGIIYILGAGASQKALPVVNEMFDRLKIFSLVLYISCISNPLSEEKEKKERLLEKLDEFIIEIEDRRSIDTYAKELYIKKDKSKLLNLKAILGTYLLFEEMFSDNDIRLLFEDFLGTSIIIDDESGKINSLTFLRFKTEINGTLNLPNTNDNNLKYSEKLNILGYLFKRNKVSGNYENNKTKIDQRYINFLIDTMEDVQAFSPKIKIFNWNYDSQFILAMNNLDFKVPNKEGVSEYSFLKRLNGVAVRRDINPAVISKSLSSENKIHECALCFWRLTDRESLEKNLLLKFAFEQDNKDNIITEISSHISGFNLVSDVVIIGYSFPLSNRDIDKMVFSQILNKVEYTLEKVINLNIYLQVPYNTDPSGNNYLILKNKVIRTLQSIKPELQLSDDGSELFHVKKIPDFLINTETIYFGSNIKPKADSYSTLKIKFYEQIDPNNFYIPHSF